MDNEQEFIKELELLSRKYKLKIGGCGCCGSSFINDIPDEELSQEAGYVYNSQLGWTYPGEYYWDNKGARPVK